MAISIDVNRPRNVDWKRAAALLYGDWGTSKAYVLGLAFAVAGFSSLPILLAVCAITGLVGINYLVICRHFPDGGGVYSAARAQGRTLAVIGALLLVADLTVTAALSGWAGLDYFSIPGLKQYIVPATMAALLLLGLLNWYGPKHSGGLAVVLSLPVMILVGVLCLISLPHLTTQYLEPMHSSSWELWKQFTGAILALSGVEAIANMTGVMKLDKGSTPENPVVAKEAGKALGIVSAEVVFGTALLAWAMLSMPHSMRGQMIEHKADILRLMAEHFGHLTAFQYTQSEAFAAAFSQGLGWATGILFFLLLLSAANTAIVAMIGVFYMMARDNEMPVQFTKLNKHGVPLIPLLLSVGLPCLVILLFSNFEALAGLYAIGVVGAIALNLGCCTFNWQLPLKKWERWLFGFTFFLLAAVEITLAHEKHEALFFVVCILGVGLGLRSYSQKRQGLTTVTLKHEVAEIVQPEMIEKLRPQLVDGGQRIMVAARGVTPVLRFALEEAQLRKAQLLVLYVKEVAVFMPSSVPQPQGRQKWQDDPHAAAIMSLMLKTGKESDVEVLPVYAVSSDPASTILDLTATLGVDYLFLGAAHRFSMTKLLKGDVVAQVAAGLPESIQMVIHS